MGELVAKGEKFIETLFTPSEIEYCEAKRFRNQHYAARFAAKEAFMKALGTGWAKEIAFNQIEVVNDELGKPDLVLYGKSAEFISEKGITNINLSLSHLKDIAVAIVIIETS